MGNAKEGKEERQVMVVELEGRNEGQVKKEVEVE